MARSCRRPQKHISAQHVPPDVCICVSNKPRLSVAVGRKAQQRNRDDAERDTSRDEIQIVSRGDGAKKIEEASGVGSMGKVARVARLLLYDADLIYSAISARISLSCVCRAAAAGGRHEFVVQREESFPASRRPVFVTVKCCGCQVIVYGVRGLLR